MPLRWHYYSQLTNMIHHDVKRVGIFRALFLGDMLCVIPTVRAIRNAFPNASITLIGLPWEKQFSERFNQYFTDFMEFPGWPGLPEQKPDEQKIVSFLESVRARSFDIIFQMQGNGSLTNKMCTLWGAKTVTGLRVKGEFCPDPKLFPVPPDSDHEILRFFKLLNALEIPLGGTSLEFPFTEEEIRSFQKVRETLGLKRGEYICLHAGARDPRRRWPVEKFAYVARQLSRKNYTIVLTGSREELELMDKLQDLIGLSVINSIKSLGDLSLAHLALLIGEAALLISNDTGVSHIAAALETPSVIIFSPFSDIKRWAPLNATLHRSIPNELSSDPEYVLDCSLEQLRIREAKTSSQLFNQK